MERRAFLTSVTAGLACGPAILKASAPRGTDIRIENVRVEYEDYNYRFPYKFGGRTVAKVTILNVNCTVSSLAGKSAKGFGSMPLGNLWSFPSHVLSYDDTLAAMKTLAERISTLTEGYKEYGHPIDLNWALEPQYLNAAKEVTRQSKLAEPIQIGRAHV